ncbi:MAG: hypothetical protein H6841_00180 [Planctomycetes bacterium]|nr:hypothetical protein [Planctomycetota bacterium]
MKSPLFILSVLLLSLFCIATARAEDQPVEQPVYSPWTVAQLKDSLAVGQNFAWDHATSLRVMGRQLHKRQSATVVAVGEEGATLEFTHQVAIVNGAEVEQYPVTWQEELPWRRVAEFLCPRLPAVDAAKQRVELEVAGATRAADMVVVERDGTTERYWFDVKCPGLLLKYQRDVTVSVRINGEEISFPRTLEQFDAIEFPPAVAQLNAK